VNHRRGTRPAHKAEIRALDLIIAEVDAVRRSIQGRGSEVKCKLYSEPWALFIRRMRLLSSQSWGGKIERYLRDLHGWEKVSEKQERGDAKEPEGRRRHFEMKTTMVTESNGEANFVQIRPHHGVDGYPLFVVDRDYSVVHYYLTKAQMDAELEKCGRLAHGTISGGGKRRKHAEWAIRFKWSQNDPIRKRWRKYETGEAVANQPCCRGWAEP